MRALGDGTDNLALSLGKQMLFLGINGTYLRRRNNHVQGGCQFAGSCLDLAFVHTARTYTAFSRCRCWGTPREHQTGTGVVVRLQRLPEY